MDGKDFRCDPAAEEKSNARKYRLPFGLCKRYIPSAAAFEKIYDAPDSEK